MALTYQPFAHAPQLAHIDRHPQMNVTDGERVGSVIIGSGLAVAALGRDGLARVFLVGLGAALIGRGVTGRCLASRCLGINARRTRAVVPGNSGQRVEAAIEIECPAPILYAFWRQLENLPQVMRNVKSVESHDPRYSHWAIAGAAGQTFEWDAEIINEADGRFMAWQSLPGATIRNAGSVWFEPTTGGLARLKVAFEFDSPVGSVGVALAPVFGINPEKDLQEDLQRFKEYAEKYLVPAGSPRTD